ncbi:MAG: Tm-1-like ATP-binding domain-containing protein [Propionibacteriaceae bacterium]|nr:Tm-1-like ATP-binding domain-containing protein [Propionibacteriaceae bacterium]
MTTVAILGTFDTKGPEYLWLAQRLEHLGVDVVRIDTGAFSDVEWADVSSTEVLHAAGVDPATLRQRRDRGEMMTAMGRGAAQIVRRLADRGQIHGLLSIGGSGGSSLAATAMQALPIGFPKLLVSTMASGDVQPYVGEVDATLMYSVVDVAGINRISQMVFDNAAAAIAGMAKAQAEREATPVEATKPLIGMTMFGVTTPVCDEARQRLTELGYEVLVFHATGTGGRAMEKLIESGLLSGVCDITTTELADDLVGGVLTAGPHRGEMAAKTGLPQVVSVGALDMVNFGPMDTVPAQFRARNLFVHNPTVTLMRTTADEMAELGQRLAAKLADAPGPTAIFLPLGGVSAIDTPGQPFWDPTADRALFAALRDGLAGSDVDIHEVDEPINADGVGRAMADTLHRLITATQPRT